MSIQMRDVETQRERETELRNMQETNLVGFMDRLTKERPKVIYLVF